MFYGSHSDRDTKTKKNFWYTTSESSKGQRLEVPDFWKEEFSKKQITCGEHFVELAVSICSTCHFQSSIIT
jgi:hypothetical protein